MRNHTICLYFLRRDLHLHCIVLQDIDSTDENKPPRRDLMTLLSRPSPFANETGALPIGEFEPLSLTSPRNSKIVTSDLVDSSLTQAKVLVVGAGGLGWYVQ